MKKIVTLFMIFCFLIISCARSCLAAGFALNQWSARGRAMGTSTVSSVKDPSAVAYNPAAMTRLDGVQVMAGASFIFPKADMDVTVRGNTFTNSTEDNVGIAPQLYLTAQVLDPVWIGVGVFSRYGLCSEFKSDWPGRFSSYYASITSLSLNPNVAVEIIEGLSIAAGIEVMYFEFENKRLSRTLFPLTFPNSEDIKTRLKGDNYGVGWNAAALYEPFDWLALGFSYRSHIKHRLEGDVKYDRSGAPLATAAGFYQDASAWGNIKLPDSFFFGAAVKPVEKLTLEFAAMLTRWSCYDKLEIHTDKHPYNMFNTATLIEEKDWRDSWSFHVGVEYAVTDWLDLRAGYFYDQSPILTEYMDYLVPSNDRQTVAVGLGFHWDNWTIDTYYTFLWAQERTGTVMVNDATSIFVPQTTPYNSHFHDGHSNEIGVSVGYRF